jgi:tRNA uracil 4-sulfurtransferase
VVIVLETQLLIRLGDLVLKGRNIGTFLKLVHANIKAAMDGLEFRTEARHNRIYLTVRTEDRAEAESRLSRIPGVHSYAEIRVTSPDKESVTATAAELMDSTLDKDGYRFKIETKRVDKTYPMTSQDISRAFSGVILPMAKRRVEVDVNDPEVVLHIEIRKHEAYVFLEATKGMGGFPLGIAGKGAVMMSGGIDSAVAAYLAMKQGIDVELVHFESTPMTPLESAQKVIDLARVLSRYRPDQTMTIRFVPFYALHKAILDMVPKPYTITIMRRMMYRITETVAKASRMLCLINGESVGQVASQTLESMKTVNAVVSYPVIRPLVTYDKEDIIRIARKIGTFDISVRPFEDCCSIYVPKSPATKPMAMYARRYEGLFDHEALIGKAVEDIRIVKVSHREPFDLTAAGLTLSDALDTLGGDL